MLEMLSLHRKPLRRPQLKCSPASNREMWSSPFGELPHEANWNSYFLSLSKSPLLVEVAPNEHSQLRYPLREARCLRLASLIVHRSWWD